MQQSILLIFFRFLQVIVCRTGDGALTAIKQNILIPVKQFFQRIEITAWETVRGFQNFQKDGFQQMYPYVGLKLTHCEHGRLSFLKTISFQIKKKMIIGYFTYNFIIFAS